MADDIDIEEHDVLDDPHIKSMFPDLALVKTEAADDEDEFPYEDYADYNASAPVKVEPINDNEDLAPAGNKIIIGSKPSPTVNRKHVDLAKENLKAYVLVENLGPMLENSPCYCQECEILFDTVNTLDAHKAVAHSLLAIAPSVNRAVKSTAKPHDTNSLLVCNHCNNQFPDNSSLITHLYMVMDQPKNTEETNKNVIRIGSKVNSDKVHFQCTVCSCYFDTKYDFTCHVNISHKLQWSQPKMCAFNKKCVFCPLLCKDPKSYHSHVFKCHPNIFSGTLKSGKLVNYKCLQCGVLFADNTSSYQHKAEAHPNMKYKHITQRVFVDLKALYNNPVVKEEKDIKPIPTVSTDAIQKLDVIVKNPKQVPSSYLFKCVHCEAHFLNGATAKGHISLCQRGLLMQAVKNKIVKCPKCSKNFRDTDMYLHEFQHIISKEFTVLSQTSKSSIDNYLYECGLCHTLLDTFSFPKHTETCDKTPRSVQCQSCALSIHTSCMQTHKNKHAQNKFDDMTIIKCVPFKKDVSSTLQINRLKRKLVEHEPTAIKRKDTTKLVALYYCPLCECVAFRRQIHHHKGFCLNKDKKICTFCGFYTTIKSDHQKLHTEQNLTLKDFLFLDLNGQPIPTPMPNYTTCINCNVRSAFKHDCLKLEIKKCIPCNKVFDIDTYKLHCYFHEPKTKSEKPTNYVPAKKPKTSDIPDLLEKYESLQAIWNILYQCSTCHTVTDSYDVVVEHCQAHYSNMESFGIVLQNCEICKLAFQNNCYKKHKELHERTDLKRDSFRVIQFDYLHLHLGKWFQMFESLQPEIINLIQSTSMYKETRSVKMREIQSGNNDKTLYLCGKCNRIVEIDDIKTHAFQNACLDASSVHKCKECLYDFDTDTIYKYHLGEDVHHVNIDSFRILVFNKKEDQVILNAMRKSAGNEVSMKTVDIQGATTTNTLPKTPMVVAKKSVQGKHRFFRCTKCNLCLSRIKSVNRHRCSKKYKSWKCIYCKLHVPYKLRHVHCNMHKKVYGLNAAKLHVTDFKPSTQIKNAVLLTAKQKIEASIKIRMPGSNQNGEENVGKITIKLITNRTVLYRCIECDVCFLSQKQLYYHLATHNKPIDSGTCDECGLNFKKNYLSQHVTLHHKKKNLTRNHFVIKSKSVYYKKGQMDTQHIVSGNEEPTPEEPTPEETTLEESKDTTDIENLDEDVKIGEHTLFKCYICAVHLPNCRFLTRHMNDHIVMRKIQSIKCKTCKLDIDVKYIQAHRILHERLKIDEFDVIKNPIAYCNDCDLYYHNFNTFYSHGYRHINNEKKISQGKKCTICKFEIVCGNFDMHMDWCHVKNDLTPKDMKVLHWKLLVKRRGVDDEDDNEEKKESDELNASDAQLKPNEIKRTVFKCSECSIHFLDITDHTHKGGKVVRKSVKCDDCDLNFLERDLAPHVELHHAQMQLERNRILVKTVIPLYRCTKCSLCFHHFINIAYHINNHERRSIKKMITQTCEFCGYTFSNTTYRQHIIDFHNKDPKLEQFKVIDWVLDDAKELVENTKDNDNDTVASIDDSTSEEVAKIPSPNTRKYKIKLYKCGDCNVCFLSQSACYKHVLKHTPMDVKDYVQCKICNLQFSIMILHKHMRNQHNDDSFSLEDVLIEEYRPNEGSPKIEIYYAVDRVQSELVSTTCDAQEATSSRSVSRNTNVDDASENSQ